METGLGLSFGSRPHRPFPGRIDGPLSQHRVPLALIAFDDRGSLGILQAMAGDKNFPPELRIRAARVANFPDWQVRLLMAKNRG